MQTNPKNVERIEEIRVNIDARATLNLSTPFFKRMVNREFHIVTAKLFVQLKTDRSPSGKLYSDTAEALTNFGFEISCLVLEAKKYIDNEEIRLDWEPTSYPLRLVSPQSASLFRFISKADQSAYALYAAERAGLISRVTREEMLVPIEMAFNRIKQIALGFERKSAAQIAEELSIA
ncbi:hypothetical protein ICN48_06295 [Polynucleobacter sp. JS-Safj-400b-B2]|uniref:hypothetical protein n=1 Tax=Polynucleobacter sp. JS-Safj-400b-B2 TaxID=2576921 RepID=UPI001C0B67C1|nr:hypothetical protein [Polynucleobacter sp. JS-Safj-400b-B2]MBU3625842.1 hypothetical protein [Polynucleobacter sp. JS-Safj-400b-B2]